MSPEDIGYIWIYDEGLFHQSDKRITTLKPSNHGIWCGSKPNTVEKSEVPYKSKLDNPRQTDVQIFPKEFFVCV